MAVPSLGWEGNGWGKTVGFRETALPLSGLLKASRSPPRRPVVAARAVARTMLPGGRTREPMGTPWFFRRLAMRKLCAFGLVLGVAALLASPALAQPGGGGRGMGG